MTEKKSAEDWPDTQKADDALKDVLETARDTCERRNWKKTANSIIAKNTLHMDLGLYADSQRRYNLDQDTRDRLIVHGRQDAANALLNTITLMEEVQKLNYRSRNTQIGVIGIVVLFISIIIWIWWPR